MCVRETTPTSLVMYLSLLNQNFVEASRGHNSHTVSGNLILFDRDIYQVK